MLFFLQADLNCNIQDDTGAFYGVTSQYESSENMTITCSTKVCSFGKQVVEKVEVGTIVAISYLPFCKKRNAFFQIVHLNQCNYSCANIKLLWCIFSPCT